MKRLTAVGGIRALAFSVLTVATVMLANPPGGTYSAPDAVKYVKNGHQLAVVVAAHLAMLSVLGLICALSYFRDVLSEGSGNERLVRFYWVTGIVAAAVFAAGWGILLMAALAHLFGGHTLVIAPAVTYLASEAGIGLVFGPGAIMLGAALVTLALGARAALPVWVRGLTILGGIGGIASIAYFPFFLVLIWGLVVGIWLLAAGPSPAPAMTPQPSA
jgi:hypothetical protein